jgi:hypothetical protein
MTVHRNHGFAIIVVLASLLVLTALFAISSTRSMAHIQNQSAEQYLAANDSHRVTLLQLVLAREPNNPTGGQIALPAPFHEQTLRLQDVGGLIDLNSASPELLEKMFRHLQFPDNAQESFRSWRRDGRRLMRIDDLIRITNADPVLLPDLAQAATVFSGRRGIAIEHAPEKVLEIVRDGGSTINDSDISAASNTNFRVYLQDADNSEQMIGVVSIFGSNGQSRILEAR